MGFAMLEIDPKLDKLASAAEAYVEATFGQRIGLVPTVPAGLPHYIIDRYQAWQGSFLGRSTLFVAWKRRMPSDEGTRAYLKHRALLRDALDADLVILLVDEKSAAIRKQLVRQQIAFLAPGLQLYVPELLFDQAEKGGRAFRTSSIGEEKRETVSPTTQVLVIAKLLQWPVEDMNLSELAAYFKVTAMSMSRAVDELEAIGIAEDWRNGVARRVRFKLQGRELWDMIGEDLRSPVRKVRRVTGELSNDEAPIAGESALAKLTMLSSPRVTTRAIADRRWKEVSGHIRELSSSDYLDSYYELETWSYDPRALSPGEIVDRLSLYLSTREHPDERVSAEAESLIESMPW